MLEARAASFCAAMCSDGHHDQCEAWMAEPYEDTMSMIASGKRQAFLRKRQESKAMKRMAMAMVEMGYLLACYCERDHTRLP